ncbi:MAG: DUF2147 domain-containing protein [Leptolyngbyaceae cyanobacterium MAG.088]|nr:DUF2147 domain-containing protein [Leptolyngbyaceae cyanobacterium MAG.088]
MDKKLIERSDILGDWINADKTSKTQIYEDPESSCFHAKVTWILKDESNPDGPELDCNNPDESLRQRRISGLEFITGLQFNERKKEWQGGRIYSPKDGKTFYLKVWFLDNKDTLNLRPSVDAMGITGKNLNWYRYSE